MNKAYVVIAKGSYAQGRGQKGFYCYVVVWAVKESPNRYGYSYIFTFNCLHASKRRALNSTNCDRLVMLYSMLSRCQAIEKF
jgi:hypothetical protein